MDTTSGRRLPLGLRVQRCVYVPESQEDAHFLVGVLETTATGFGSEYQVLRREEHIILHENVDAKILDRRLPSFPYFVKHPSFKSVDRCVSFQP